MTNHIEEWVEALRSGEYKQGGGKLRNGDKFCCLGVACDLYMQATGDGGWTDDGAFVLGGSASEDCRRDYSFPPEEVAKWVFALVDVHLNGLSENLEIVDRLANMNDTGVSFENIATYILENMEQVNE